jgi:hypothetical protein
MIVSSNSRSRGSGPRYPHPRKVIFDEQREQQLRIVAVGLLLADSLGLDLRGIADPQLDAQFCQQLLEPA